MYLFLIGNHMYYHSQEIQGLRLMKMPRNTTNLIKFYRKFGIQRCDCHFKIWYWLKILALFQFIGEMRGKCPFRSTKHQISRTYFGHARGYPMLPGYPNLGSLEPTYVCEDILLKKVCQITIDWRYFADSVKNRRFGDL